MSKAKGKLHLGLIGYPLGHSFSPRLHHAALAAAGLVGEYRLFAIPPTEKGTRQIAELLEQIRSGALDGLNVTIPHKQTVIPMVDMLTDVARAVGAVNTLYMWESVLVGDNTDVPGFLHDLERLCGSRRGHALVLGAGGSARAAAYALASRGWQVAVLARNEQQSEVLVRSLAGAAGLVGSLEAGLLTEDALRRRAGSLDLLVNTTPLGMHPNDTGCPWPENLPMPEHAAVYDLVYNPLETVLARRARESGLRAMTGAGMLASQAALAFAKWTGTAAPFDTMERAFFEPQGASEE